MILLLPFLLFFLNSDKNDRIKNHIAWDKNKKLKWEHFTGNPKKSDSFSAVSSVQLVLDYKISGHLKKYQITCVFVKDESWHVDTSTYLLQHEQGHFDIGEIQARKLRAELNKIKSTKQRISAYELDLLFRKYWKLLAEQQSLYDNETKHSTDYYNQIKWNELIKSDLESL